MTKYSKIRHQDLHTQNIMIKKNDIPDKEIIGVSMEDKIKNILNNSKFKINIKLIDYGEVREIHKQEEKEYFDKPLKMQDFLFTNYNKVFEEDFIYAKFLSLTDISEILSTKDSLDIGEINLKKLKYYDIYKGSIEALVHINDEYFKRLEHLLQEAAPLRDGVAQEDVAQGKPTQVIICLF